MVCTICQSASSKNPFTKPEGCKTWQNSALTRHQDTNEHRQSIKTLELRSQMQAAAKNVESKNVELQSDKIENYMKQLRLVYCLCKNDIAASNFNDLMQVQVLNGVTCDYYKKPEIVTEFEQCIESVMLHFLKAVSNSFLDSARLHLLHILGWFPYVFALYTFVTLFRGFLIYFFFQHTDLVYICYILWDVFPMYLHCIRSLHFLRAVSNSFLDSASTCVTYTWVISLCICIVYVRYAFQRIPDIFFFSTYRSCIHLLHLMGCFPYVFALYTFVTLFESCI